MIIHVKDNQATNPEALKRAFKVPDGIYNLELKSRNRRSLNQNAYFHGPVLELVLQGLRDAGYDEVKTKQDAKLVLKTLFLKKSITNGIEEINIIRETSSLTKEEFGEFIQQIQKWASEYLNVIIEDPYTQMKLI